MKKLKNILSGITVLQLKGSLDVSIGRINFDSRKIANGDLFIAVKGTQTDGHTYIEKAIEKGAKVIVCQELPAHLDESIIYCLVADSAFALGVIAHNYYDRPSEKIKLVGVTGTNGKTTVATLLYQLFEGLGYYSGLVSTVQNKIGDRIIPSTHTTPDPISLNDLLHDMVENGCDYCFMEVSSHAIVQKRISGLKFTGGLFTNISHDHLDFHLTFDNYIKAKKLFFDTLPKNAFALTNIDDRNGMVMLQNTKAYKKTYGLKSLADYNAQIIESHFSGMLLNINKEEVWVKLVGEFNAHNILAVYSTAMLLDQDSKKVLTVLSRLKGAEGRFETMISKNGKVAIVDYAHTPDALENVLLTIRQLRMNEVQIITVVGCGGDRDKSKRAVMAKVAVGLSDKVILTSDNPRSEDPLLILKDMEEGISFDMRRKSFTISDRREAIRAACHLAQEGDIILVAGKGHETYQEIKGVKHPFDDREVLKETFKEQ
ncbi:UDP-N-acetylmuramoyl-L-alanyl-D-glutamate--2,6-diaminopimelate ligase [Albibacterium sp.]|uniref:UDP-N-acetylmuramoyl-L-alanyl-D-glutamate--2, 6-diaminopimelate ligase n=1 Tax=Albibacterium sp. TaxID=2952885 RepID=UPI002C0C145A|nr:UDP-N-acetylmuramoyl-L-alanyl-D-glutamate--2,6-diaminopimelate ligase [Albibacterium sp.]HUH17891.1 UDP-N-acetylmuramoyl-L-alanyl-D-glutamate--2,6-diaminopimelate ligase [Albibacterium sp.]